MCPNRNKTKLGRYEHRESDTGEVTTSHTRVWYPTRSDYPVLTIEVHNSETLNVETTILTLTRRQVQSPSKHA